MHRTYNILRTPKWRHLFLLPLVLLPLLVQAEPQSRKYTREHPLIYEDAWDLWPYAFLNETGKPVGYNIDLLEIIFKKLDIPFKIKLKPTQDALYDLKAGNSDLMCGMEAPYHDAYGQYSKNIINIFTQ